MKKFFLFITLLLMLCSNSVYAQSFNDEDLVNEHILQFYKKFACINKKYSSYEEILKEYPADYYYAKVKLFNKTKYPVLFVTDSVYDYDDTTKAAEYAILYAYKKDKKIHVIGYQFSKGYPLSATKRFFYWGGKHKAVRYFVDAYGTLIIDKDAEEILKDDNIKYDFFSYKGIPQGISKSERRLKGIRRQVEKAKPINFNKIETYTNEKK